MSKAKKDDPPRKPPPPPNVHADFIEALERFASANMGPDGWKRIDVTVIAEGDGPNLNLVWPTG